MNENEKKNNDIKELKKMRLNKYMHKVGNHYIMAFIVLFIGMVSVYFMGLTLLLVVVFLPVAVLLVINLLAHLLYYCI